MRRMFMLALSALAAQGVQASESTGLTSQDMEQVIVRDADVRLAVADLYSQLARMTPGGLQDLTESHDSRMRLLRAELSFQRVLKAARDSGYFEQPKARARLRAKISAAMVSMYMDHYVKQHMTADYALRAKEYYLLHKDEFKRPEQRKVSHMLFQPEDFGGDEGARAAAETFLESMHGDGSVLETAAKKLLKSNPEIKGVASFFGARSQFVKPFADAAFALQKPALVEQVVKTKFGYHVIRVDSITSESTRDFAEVKAGLITKEKQKDDHNIRVDYVQDKKAIDPDAVNTEALLAIIKKIQRAKR